MATTKKTTKKGGKAQKKDGPRIKRYGCTTYRSEPQDNPDCRGRCSPPARMVSQDGKTKVTQIRYRRRNLDVVRKNCACDIKPSSKTKKTTAKKTTAKKTAKAVKTVKKAPVKTVKAPAKKSSPSGLSPATKEFLKATGQRSPKQAQVRVIERSPVDMDMLSPATKEFLKATGQKPAKACGCAVTPTKSPSKPKTVTCGCAQTPAKVKEAILNKAEKEGMNRKELDKHIVVATVPRIEAKAKAEPPKRTYTVSNPLVLNINGAPYYVWEVSNGFKGSKEHPDQRIVNARAISNFERSHGFNSIKDVVDYINKYFVKPTPTPAKKAPAKKAPAKKAPAKPTAPIQSRGVAGRFDAKQLKEIAQFIDKLDDDGRIPIFRQSATFIDDGHVMMVRVSSRIPGRSLVGLPISKTKADIWVPAEKIKERLSQAKDVQAVEYTGDSFEYTGNGGKLHFLMGNIDVATQAYHDYDDIRLPRMPSELMKKDPADIVFRTTQSRFATDMKKVMTGCEKGEDCAVQVCPEGKYSKYEDYVPMECSTYSANYMKMIANVISKAKNSQCVVIYRPAWPIKVICDFGMYLVEIILAPVVKG